MLSAKKAPQTQQGKGGQTDSEAPHKASALVFRLPAGDLSPKAKPDNIQNKKEPRTNSIARGAWLIGRSKVSHALLRMQDRQKSLIKQEKRHFFKH